FYLALSGRTSVTGVADDLLSACWRHIPGPGLAAEPAQHTPTASAAAPASAPEAARTPKQQIAGGPLEWERNRSLTELPYHHAQHAGYCEPRPRSLQTRRPTPHGECHPAPFKRRPAWPIRMSAIKVAARRAARLRQAVIRS